MACFFIPLTFIYRAKFSKNNNNAYSSNNNNNKILNFKIILITIIVSKINIKIIKY